MRTILAAIILTNIIYSSAHAEVYKIVCGGVVSYSNVAPPAPVFSYSSNPDVECVDVTREMKKAAEEAKKEKIAKEKADAKRRQEESARINRNNEAFRKNLKVGDKTSHGLVVEVKAPIALIQKEQTTKWIRIDELYPQLNY